MANVYQQRQVGDNGQDSGGYGQDAAEIDEQMKENAEERSNSIMEAVY